MINTLTARLLERVQRTAREIGEASQELYMREPVVSCWPQPIQNSNETLSLSLFLTHSSHPPPSSHLSLSRLLRNAPLDFIDSSVPVFIGQSPKST